MHNRYLNGLILLAVLAAPFLPAAPAGAVFKGSSTSGGAASYPQLLGTCSYYQDTNASGAADQTTALQDWLLNCQISAFALSKTACPSCNAATLDDQMQRSCIRAVLPRGNYQITSPLVIPENVCADFQGTIVRVGQSGSPSNFYNGDTTSLALANLEEPAIIIAPRAHALGTLSVYGNSNGADNGSGFAIGKNWWGNSATIQAIGSGYHVNDVLTGANPSKPPYSGWEYTVSAVDGNGGITAGAMTIRGAYALPPLLQQRQWTAANGFTGATANGSIGSVFDPNHAGWFKTVGGNGTGAEFTITWVNDFAGGGATYSCNDGSLVGDTWIENLNGQQLGVANDATYGPMFGTIWCGLNFELEGYVTTNGGYYGNLTAGVADLHGTGFFNPVNAVHGMKILQGGSMDINLFCDTDTADCLEIDNAETVNVHGYCINPGSAMTGSAAVVLGGDTVSGASNLNVGLNIDMNLFNCGGIPAGWGDFTSNSKINLISNNTTQGGGAVDHPNTKFFTFNSSHWDGSNILTGSIDRLTGSLFTGSIPNAGIQVWDSNLKGWALGSGAYHILGAGVPTSGGSGTGLNKAGIGSLYDDTTNGVEYINSTSSSSPTWTAFSTGAGGSSLGTSAAATSPSRSGQAGTGLYTPGSNQVAIAVNGHEGLEVDDTALATEFLTVTNGVNGGAVSLAVGGGGNVNLSLSGAGLGGVTFNNNNISGIAGATITGATNTGYMISGGTKFTTSGCSVSATSGGGAAGVYTSGTTGTCTVTITINGATGATAPNGWACNAHDRTTVADVQNQTASSTTTATISGTTVSGDVISFDCVGY